MSNSAIDDYGNWSPDRVMLGIGGLFIGLVVVLIWPVSLLPNFVHDDSLMHLSGGIALTLVFAALIPREDHQIAAAVMFLGVIWEPYEAYHFYCTGGDWLTLVVQDAHGTGRCSVDGVVHWMNRVDTVKDMSLVWCGSLLCLVGIGRYK